MSSSSRSPSQAYSSWSPATADSRATALPGSRQQRLRLLAVLGVVGGLALVAWSIYVRTRAFGLHYWIDEGLSIGIARHDLVDIPGVLRQDGSPPLYYVLLHFWTGIFGTDEFDTHALSLVFSTLTIPVGLWGGWKLFGRWAGIVTGILCAGNPFLTAYAQETRMYSLVVLLSLLATVFFLFAFVQRERRYIPFFAVSLAALLYTHLWAAFFVLASGALWLGFVWFQRSERKQLFRDGLLGFGGAFLLWLPWLPTAIYQLQHTAAPWAHGPTWRAAQQIPLTLGGGKYEWPITAIAALVGLVVAWRVRARGERAAESVGGGGLLAVRNDRAGWIAFALLALIVGLAWTISNASGVWANRYFAVFVGPFLIWLGWSFARAGVIGIAALVILGAGFQFYPHTPERMHLKSNVNLVVTANADRLRRGDIVLSTHPEQIPLIYHYMNQAGAHGLRYATQMGWFPDPQVMDWRDVTERLERTRVSRDLVPILDDMRVGQQLYMIRPITSRESQWTAPWTSAVRRRSRQWIRAMDRDPRFELDGIANASLQVGHRNSVVQGRLYVKTRD